jgi:hypothetical protein
MRKFVIIASIIADLLDFTFIGHFIYPIDMIVIIIHMLYAGPKALIGVLDMCLRLGYYQFTHFYR